MIIEPTSTAASYVYYVDAVEIYQNSRYVADVVSYSDYYPYGMQMPGRNGNSGEYRYGFNGMEADDEVKGQGNSYTTEFRQYDPRLGRWLSLDPLMGKYPHISPYTAFNNNPVYYIDPLGLEGDPPAGLPENPEDESVHKADNGNMYQWLEGEDGGSWSFYREEVTVSGTAKRTNVSVSDALELADNSYVKKPKAGKTDRKLPNDWKLSPLMDQLDIKWQNPDTGFKSALYEKEDANGRKMYVYAFAGTDDYSDAQTDVAQVIFGLTKQLSQADENTSAIINEIKNSLDLTVVGHSLGGGIANSVALKYGVRSWGFNPAWPSDDALAGIGASRTNDSKINNVVTVGDILHRSQIGLQYLYDIAPVGTTYMLSTGSFVINSSKIHSHLTFALRMALRHNGY